MLIITGTFRVAADKVDAARPAMAAMVLASRAEPGCLEYSYGEDVLAAGLIHVIERWTSRDTLAAHGQAPHIKEWRAAWPALGIGERDLTLYEADGGVGI
ncbi:MAG: putative quinol monooxygenase [Pseudomonadota bacterium]